MSVSLIAQPASSNLEKRRASESQPVPSQTRLGLFESQHSLEGPAANEIPTLLCHPPLRMGSLSPSPGADDMKQGVVSPQSPARPQQEGSFNRTSQSPLHSGVLSFQERSSKSSTRTSSEMSDRPVTIQPSPLELNHPLAPENRQCERPCVQPASLDGQTFGDGSPKRGEGRGGQLENHSPPGTGNRRKWCCPCLCR